MTTLSLHDRLSLSHGPSWANRFALAPLTNTQSNADGTLSEDEYRWLVARAEGGFGLTMTCATYVARAGQAWGGDVEGPRDAEVAELAQEVTAIPEGKRAERVRQPLHLDDWSACTV